MNITIGDFDAVTRSVAVNFQDGDVRHARAVNACLDDDGAYDADATRARVDDVACGVAQKIALGVIVPAAPSDRHEVS